MRFKKITSVSVSILLSFVLFSNCGILVNHEDLCADDLKKYDECFTLMLAVDPGCGQGVGTCTPAYVQLSKTFCDSRMSMKGCRAHRD